MERRTTHEAADPGNDGGPWRASIRFVPLKSMLRPSEARSLTLPPAGQGISARIAFAIGSTNAN